MSSAAAQAREAQPVRPVRSHAAPLHRLSARSDRCSATAVCLDRSLLQIKNSVWEFLKVGPLKVAIIGSGQSTAVDQPAGLRCA